jgi:hypothetical protein
VIDRSANPHLTTAIPSQLGGAAKGLEKAWRQDGKSRYVSEVLRTVWLSIIMASILESFT